MHANALILLGKAFLMSKSTSVCYSIGCVWVILILYNAICIVCMMLNTVQHLDRNTIVIPPVQLHCHGI